MSTVLVADRRELHAHERIEAQHAERVGGFGLDDIRGRQGIIWPHSFTSEDDMDRVPGFRFGTVEKPIDASGVAIEVTTQVSCQ